MTKDEYGDFVLRYKGCGACFPMYHTLNRFEKMWFTAIQKDVADLKKENESLTNIKNIYIEDLLKAKEILKKFLDAKSIEETCVAESEAEQFLSCKEILNN
jgi:hypothetical protein